MELPRLKEVRELHGWSQAKLAEESGVSRDSISNYETGHREPWPATAKKLADALGVEIEDLARPKAGAPSRSGQPEEIHLESRDDIAKFVSEIVWNLPESEGRRLVVNIHEDDSADIHIMPSGTTERSTRRKKRAEK